MIQVAVLGYGTVGSGVVEVIEKNKAEDFIRKTEKRRASYYNYYTDMKWGEAKNFDLCINSSKTGIEGAVKLMLDYISLKEGKASE